MRTEESTRLNGSHLSERTPPAFVQESSLTPRSSRSSSRSISGSSISSSSSSSGHSYSSSDQSRSPSVSRRSRRHSRHGSRFSSDSSSSFRSRSRPRCYRVSDRSRCCRRHRSRRYSPNRGRSTRRGDRRYSRSNSRSSSRGRYYRRSRRSRSRSSSYRRTRGAHIGRYRCRFSPSPVRRYSRDRSKSPECSIRLSQKDKKELLNIARENAAKILGVDVVKLPTSVSYHEEHVTEVLEFDSDRRVRPDPVPLKKRSQNEGVADEDGISRVSPAKNR
ncbi:arginine/serine-rich protein 1 isoform X1 [Silurus meridionalis]|uniref:Arginine/serine-rich protein 1 n=1 Tax=Silurus meridionalis TaxID=175797 RepID=A0A8T0BUA5_SILME|nr:arginine/serine-rich protein 1 isoform X1 [Silurus meridionalis]KAF7710872.1 hypothetical protein HF521_009744 [Silurus meridionalis]